jgi:DNA-binding Xre family transcriptional regulator
MFIVIEHQQPLIHWKLRELMARKKKTNQEVAEMLNKHWTTISRWRTSDEMPKIDGADLEGLCKALDCQISDLIERIPDSDHLEPNN